MVAVFDFGIDLDVWPWVWLAMATLFVIVEITALAGTFILLPFAISAFFASIAGFYDAPIEAQWAIFFLGGVALWALFWRYAKRFMAEHSNPEGVGADRLVGMTAIVTSAIDPDDIHRRGRVKVAGEDWGALVVAGGVIESGAKVRIAEMAGTRVVVERIAAGPPPTEPPLGPPGAATTDESTRGESS